jgi:hypothetical protein
MDDRAEGLRKGEADQADIKRLESSKMCGWRTQRDASQRGR